MQIVGVRAVISRKPTGTDDALHLACFLGLSIHLAYL